MRFRLKAFGLHLTGSVIAMLIVMGGLYLGWYRWPGWYLTGVLHVAVLVLCVDVCLGPLVTLLIANPKKPKRELARDVAIIVAVQLTALVYGAAALWQGRPLYYVFSLDRLELVQANDLGPEEIDLGRRRNPSLAPHWYSRPRWIYAPLPDDPAERSKITMGTLFGGNDVIQMPKYFQPWEAGLPALQRKLITSRNLPYFSPHQRQILGTRIARLGIAPDQPTLLLLTGGGHFMVAVFDGKMRMAAIVAPD